MSELDLIFPGMALGTHQTPWDLKILLHRGAASIPRKQVAKTLNEAKIDTSDTLRLAIVCAFHEAISSMISQGRSRALVESSLEVLWRFISWSDNNSLTISHDSVIEAFKKWAEYQIHRSKIKKEVSEIYAYRQTSILANIIAKALKLPGKNSGRNLLILTRMRKPRAKKKVLSSKADKQNLDQTFEFGHSLKTICEVLDLATVRGPLPIKIDLENKKNIFVSGSLKVLDLDISSIKNSGVRHRAEIARAPLADNESLFDRHKRSGIINLRIESELLMFIAQTGMNLAQAAMLERESYRWKSNGDDLEVFRVYKGRRSGEVVFRCYRSYKEHLESYLKWLDDTGLSENDGRLFPIQSRGMIRARDAKIGFNTLRTVFKKVDIQVIGPQELRKTRVNWLLRRSRDVSLTAEQVAHGKEVLLRDYERPHHQSSASEIIQFHRATDPAYSPPGPGICVDKDHTPEVISDIAKETPKPDCVSPEGCLFCTKHRDIMSSDYCWKLASHAKIKILETTLHKPSVKQEIHPAYHVIERINKKLDAIASGSEIRAMWVKDSRNAVRAGRYHPYWNGHIQLLEIIT